MKITFLLCITIFFIIILLFSILFCFSSVRKSNEWLDEIIEKEYKKLSK
ncbi:MULTISPECIES: hypothetical protein [Clostridium]|nr:MULTISPECIES: hypothetical protein [Clostridium]MCD2347254.1 hypothetical protein [Clostridium guangxiense]